MDAMQEIRDLDRRLNAATDPAEMKALITRRRLLRAGMDFAHAVDELAGPGPIRTADVPRFLRRG